MSSELIQNIHRLADLATRRHDRAYHFDREGHPIPLSICKKWETRYYEKDGIHCREWYGKLDLSADCTCGAQEHNDQVALIVADLLSSFSNRKFLVAIECLMADKLTWKGNTNFSTDEPISIRKIEEVKRDFLAALAKKGINTVGATAFITGLMPIDNEEA